MPGLSVLEPRAPAARRAAGRRSRAVVLALGLLVLLVAGPGAAAAETLVLVDVPARVESAVRSSLAPWGIAVVVVAEAPTVYEPGALAAERGAAYVVWRDGGALRLYDAALAAEERRPLTHEPDDAEAAAVALSIKAWMGLGPPPGGELVCGLADCPRPPARAPRWLVEIATGVRGGLGGEHVGFRYGVAAGLRRGRLEAGVRLDLGMDSDGRGFEGTGVWSVTTMGAWVRAAWRVTPSVAVVPGVGVGLVRTGFQSLRTGPGAHDDADSSTALGLDAEIGARWQRGRVTAGGRLGITAVPSTQVLESRSLEEVVEAHVQPWLAVTLAIAL